jgi:hypothetical protein
VLHFGVADKHSNIPGQIEWAIVQRAAIKHQRLSGLAVAGCKLIHNAASSPDKFIFGALA